MIRDSLSHARRVSVTWGYFTCKKAFGEQSTVRYMELQGVCSEGLGMYGSLKETQKFVCYKAVSTIEGCQLSEVVFTLGVI